MNMRRWMGLCLLILLPCVGMAITAIPSYRIFYLPAENGKPLQPYIEFYWQVDPNTVSFNKNENGHFVGRVKTWIEIMQDTSVAGSTKYVLQTPPAASLEAAHHQNIMDMQRYVLPYGKINIRLRLEDENNSAGAFVFADSLTIAQPALPAYTIPQLLDTFYETDLKDNVFVKNGSMQIPLCLDFLDEYRRYIHYYTELHGANQIPEAELPMIQLAYMSKKPYDLPVNNLTSVDTLQLAAVIPMTGSFKIAGLASGNYYLNIVLKNARGAELAKTSTFFQRSNPHPVVVVDTTKRPDSLLFEKVQVFDLSKTFVGKYTAPQLKAILKMLAPIASESEKLNINAFTKKPDETHMRYFVYNFWKEHSPADPEGGWERYTKTVRDVNKMFTAGNKPGYETDRGFYYLKYGPPDQRYAVPNEEGALPYEVWHYNAPGKQGSPGAFLFYNPGFMGNDFQLLHTTVIGEMRNTNWRASLYKLGASTNNLNSRAEQIFQNK